MKPYGLFGGHAFHISKGRDRFAGRQEARRQYDQMVNDYNYYIWSDDVKENYLCIYCKAKGELCGDCEYWNDIMNKEIQKMDNLYGMSVDRYNDLQVGQADQLTKEEIEAGWSFCSDCDGMLFNLNDDMECCKIEKRNNMS